MSCSVHDVVRFEKLGIPTANVATDAFVEESDAQGRILGMPEYRGVWLPHPVAILTDNELRVLAGRTVDELVEKLVQSG